MRRSERGKLVVIGAGPKGLAVAVKAKVLGEFGFPTDEVVLIEKHEVAANWSGDFGYTNGEMKLGTSPEKDVVFPLETEAGDPHLTERVRRRLMEFSWVSFLVQTSRYSDWVDRGRPAPCHQLWAMYLRWVATQLGTDVPFIRAEVLQIGISADSRQWELTLSGRAPVYADRLMLTGPGKTRMDFVGGSELPEGTYDLESFWAANKAGEFEPQGRIAVVGAGENAASVLLALSAYTPQARVDVISPKGFVSTRAEGFYENQVYSQPERIRWSELELGDRQDFIERTDLGVFSQHAMSILNEQVRHQIVAGRVAGLRRENGALSVALTYGAQIFTKQYDQVILATGFDQLSALKAMMTAAAVKRIEAALGAPLSQKEVARSIQGDLSIAGLYPKLHLPMLAGLMQGPGFANLSCLGRLSDRVIMQPAVREAAVFKESVI